MDYFKSYGAIGCLRLFLDVLRTKLFCGHARLIRFPIFVRGKDWIVFGENFSSGRGARIEAFGKRYSTQPLIHFGRDVRINDYVHIGATCSVVIGDRVLIASKVFITDHNHGEYGDRFPHSDPAIPPSERPLSSRAVLIEADVWLGEHVVVLPGVTIGRGAIVGASSTVTKDIPPYSIAVGSPARVIKRYRPDSCRWEAV